MTQSDLAILRDQLQHDEGLRLRPYVDTVGKITIGYGRNLSDQGITQTEADEFLEADIASHTADLLTAYPVVEYLDSVRQIVLANMAFNLGIARLSQFVLMWAAINRSDYAQAAIEMLNSLWAKQVGARATRLAAAMASGAFQ